MVNPILNKTADNISKSFKDFIHYTYENDAIISVNLEDSTCMLISEDYHNELVDKIAKLEYEIKILTSTIQMQKGETHDHVR